MAVTALSGLTVKPMDHAGPAHLYLTSAHWSPSAGVYRCQNVVSGGIFKVSGATEFGIRFLTTPYSAITPVIGTIATRYATSEVLLHEAAWTYSVTPGGGAGGDLFASGLASDTYWVEWRTTHYSYGTAMTWSHELCRMAAGEVGTGWDIDGIATDGSIDSFSLTRPVLNVYVCGDSVTSDYVQHNSGDATETYRTASLNLVFYGNSLGATPSNIPLSQKGALSNYVYLALDRWCRRHGYWLNTMWRAWSGYWQSKMGPNLRDAWINASTFSTIAATPPGAMPGLYANAEDAWERANNEVASDVTVGGHWSATAGKAFVPKIAIVGTFYNDYWQWFFEDFAPLGAEDFFEATKFKQNVGSSTGWVKNGLLTQWPNCKLVLVGPTVADNAVGGFERTTTTDLIAMTEANDATYWRTLPGQADHNDVAFVSLTRASGETGLQTTNSGFLPFHPTENGHKKMAQLLDSTIYRLLGTDGDGTLPSVVGGVRRR